MWSETETHLLIGVIIVLAPFYVGAGAVALSAVGWVWAPFAAWICARAARKRGLEVRRYALAGAVYSTLFFWPWVYLLLRMHRRRVPIFVIRAFFVLVYAAWLIGSVFVWLAITIALTTGIRQYQWFHWLLLTGFLIVLVINISMWIISLKKLRRGHHKAQPDSEDKKQDVLLDRRYIIPLVFAFGWLAGDGVLLGVAFLLPEGVSS